MSRREPVPQFAQHFEDQSKRVFNRGVVRRLYFPAKALNNRGEIVEAFVHQSVGPPVIAAQNLAHPLLGTATRT